MIKTNWMLTLMVVVLYSLIYKAAFGLDCPEPPKQVNRDWDVEVKATVGKIGPVRGAELQTRTRNATIDLLSKLPNSASIYLEQMMFSAYCSAIRDDSSLKERDKAKLLLEYNNELRKSIKGNIKSKSNVDKSSKDKTEPVKAKISKIDFKNEIRGLNITKIPKALQLIAADTYLDIGSSNNVVVGDYFKILNMVKLSGKTNFKDRIGLIKIVDVDKNSSVGKIISLESSANDDDIKPGTPVEKIIDKGTKLYSDIKARGNEFKSVKYHIAKNFDELSDRLDMLVADHLAESINNALNGAVNDNLKISKEDFIKKYSSFAPYQFVDDVSRIRYTDYMHDLNRFINDYRDSYWYPELIFDAIETNFELQRYSDVISIIRELKDHSTVNITKRQDYLDRTVSLSALRNSVMNQPLNVDAHIALAENLSSGYVSPLTHVPEAIIEYHFIYLLTNNMSFLEKAENLRNECIKFNNQIKIKYSVPPNNTN